MAPFAWFGQGLSEALAFGCHWVVAMTCVPLLTWLIATWPLRGGTRLAWVSLVCVAQAIPVMLIFQVAGVSVPYFLLIWKVSLVLVLVGLVAKAGVKESPEDGPAGK